MENIETISSFTEEFEDVTIHVRQILVTRLNSLNKQLYKGFSNPVVIPNISVNELENSKNLTGEIYSTFIDINEGSNSALSIIFKLSADAPTNLEISSLYSKIIRYLFVWTERYVKEKGVSGFTLPPFEEPDNHK